MNSECRLYYDFMHLFPFGNLPLSKSMIVQALRGAGKTQIRQCIIAKLPRNNQILIRIYGVDINTYLDNFVENVDISSDHPYDKIRKYWTKEYFLQVILTEIATRFVNEETLTILEEKKSLTTLQIRKEVAILLSYYYTKDSGILCKIVNKLLHEITNCGFTCRQLNCNDFQFTQRDQELFISLTQKHRKIKVKLHNQAVDGCLRLLVAMHKRTEYSPLVILERSYREQLTLLINFLSALDFTTTVIVDSLDESKFFFNQADSSLSTLQTFVDSITNDEILNLALGNWGEGNGQKNTFRFYVFIPKKSNFSLNISWSRPDKIPIINVKWDELQLINYADYIFDYLRTQAKGQCKSLPDVCSLLGGKDLCITTMKELRHPRDFHIFFDVLSQQMNRVCTQRDSPFNATSDDLKIALKETASRVLRE
ncbi:unnamed protein product [Rotaria sp. Silwood1]|nr:unnamed protein product [Rotaria sp. Silwood1]CAF1576757.1 unnamed protein product [Rotaria sp. Silwood1]CAF3691274.1 unnamed protein product [Rotaria sp. Silwood1]CAF3741075.1 unnamed protein product [Rotaria sp. Silwood1]CAF5012553.1 unnamed protein product [Rotaria sp. Silwood1]